MRCYDPDTLDELYDCGDALQHLILFRGLPGSGKSTRASRMGLDTVSADDFFMEGGVYRFDAAKLTPAHAWCQQETRRRLKSGEDVGVANTFTQRWEIEPYRKIAEEFGAILGIVDLYDAGLDDRALSERNLHGVPENALSTMRKRYEFNWIAGNPKPPWER